MPEIVKLDPRELDAAPTPAPPAAVPPPAVPTTPAPPVVKLDPRTLDHPEKTAALTTLRPPASPEHLPSPQEFDAAHQSYVKGVMDGMRVPGMELLGGTPPPGPGLPKDNIPLTPEEEKRRFWTEAYRVAEEEGRRQQAIADHPLIPLSSAFKGASQTNPLVRGLEGASKVAEGITTPRNLDYIGSSLVSPVVGTAIGAAFLPGLVKDLEERSPEAYRAFREGRWGDLAEHVGVGLTEALMAYAGGKHLNSKLRGGLRSWADSIRAKQQTGTVSFEPAKPRIAPPEEPGVPPESPSAFPVAPGETPAPSAPVAPAAESAIVRLKPDEVTPVPTVPAERVTATKAALDQLGRSRVAPGTLVKVLGISHPDATAVLEALADEGFVERKPFGRKNIYVVKQAPRTTPEAGSAATPEPDSAVEAGRPGAAPLQPQSQGATPEPAKPIEPTAQAVLPTEEVPPAPESRTEPVTEPGGVVAPGNVASAGETPAPTEATEPVRAIVPQASYQSMSTGFGRHMVVATAGKNMVGSMDLVEQPNALVVNLANVPEQERGKGYGKGMYSYARDMAARLGKPYLVSGDTSTEDANRVWQSLGAERFTDENGQERWRLTVPQPERGPGWVGNIPTSEIHVDAPRFQFKQNVGQGGAGQELRGITKWDPEKAGIVSVWRDPSDGKTYVVNGHHRVELAQRADVPTMTVRYLDAPTAQAARVKGAKINIAEGRGESIDAAKIFRETGDTPESLAAEGVSPEGKLAREGVALAKLADPIFEDVVSGSLAPARGAIIGGNLPDHADQLALYDAIKARERSGKRLTDAQIAEMIRLAPPKRTETQESLFGTEEMSRSLLPEKAEVSEYVRKQLAGEKRLFGAVSNVQAAERLGEAGNVIKADANAQVALNARQGMELYDKLSTTAGPIDEVLNRAAGEIADGKPVAEAKQQAYREIKQHLTEALERLGGGQGLGPKGALQTRGQHQNTVDARGTGGHDAGGTGALRPAESQGVVPEPPPNALKKATAKRKARVATNKAKLTGTAGSGQESAPQPKAPLFSRKLRGAPLNSLRKYSPNEVAADVDAETVPAHNGHPAVVRANWQAIRYFAAVFGETGDIHGAWAQPSMLIEAADTLRNTGQNAHKVGLTAAQGNRLIAFADQLDIAARDPDGAAIVDASSNVPFRQVAQIMYHEFLHSAQRGMVNAQGEHVDYGAVQNHPVATKMAKALGALGYPQDPETMTLEMATHAASGPEGWKDAGITPDEAVAFLQHYFQEVEKAHPGRGDELLQWVYPSIRRKLASSSQQSQKSSVDGAAPGSASAPAPTTVRPGSGGSQLAPSRRSLRKGGTRGSEAGIPADVSSGQPGLFGEEAEQQSREDDQRYRDKLLGEQLTAQFKSGMAVKPSNLKPAQNRNLFENPPEPGMLFSRKAQGGPVPGDEEESALHYSGLRAWKDVFVRGLSQLEKVSEKAHAAAVRLASARAQVAALIRAAMPRIAEALGTGKDGPSPQDFRKALIESRLRGIRDRWNDMAGDVLKASDKELARAARKWLFDLLGNIERKDAWELSPPQTIKETAAALLDRNDYDGLRRLLSKTFEAAAERVARVFPEGDFDRITQMPGFKRGLAAYKELFEKEVAKNHELNEGIFSDALGPLGTYYPLIPTNRMDQARAGAGPSLPYRKPNNIANRFATGLELDYDPSIEALQDRLRRAFRNNDKAALLDTLELEGLAKRIKLGEPAPDSITVRGKKYRAAVVEFSTPIRIETSSGPKLVGAKRAVVPAWLEDELRPILDKRNLQLYNPNGLMAAITKFTLTGPLDATIHSANLIGTLVANTPFIGDSLAGRIAGNFPFTKRAAALFKLLTTDPTTEEAVRDIQEMAQLGLVPEKFGSETYSRKYAEQTGAELKRLSFGPALYGPTGIDIRARLAMFRLLKRINPDFSPKDAYLFVNQLGNYTRALQGKVERALKNSGWSPFYTAGSTMIRNGINAWTGRGPMPKNGAGWRVLQALTGGAAGTVALWAITYRAYTGKWPWEDKRARLLQIPVRPEHRHSAVGDLLWGPGRKTGYVNFGFFSPLVQRGARALGITGMFDTLAAGGSVGQGFEAALTGAINAAIHPIMGPPAKALWIGLTGTEPMLTGLRNDRAEYAPQFLPHLKKAPYGLPTVKTRALGALYSLNGFFADLANATGLGSGVLREADEKGNHWLKMVLDLAAPQLISLPSDPTARRKYLARQEKAAKSRGRK